MAPDLPERTSIAAGNRRNLMIVTETISILTVAAAVFAYINYKVMRLPVTIGLMALSLLSVVIMFLLRALVPSFDNAAWEFLSGIPFDRVVLQGVLSFLLFSGALSVDVSCLAQVRITVALLSVLGVMISTAVVGGILFLAAEAAGAPLGLVPCLIFGAIISPTDPVAVLATRRRLGLSSKLQAIIEGEALFNDGIGIVLFLTLLGMARQDGGGITSGLALFAREALGGAGFGILLGLAGFVFIRTTENFQLDILVSFALVTGGYTLAQILHVSGPISMAVAGLLLGNGSASRLALTDRMRENLLGLWETVQYLINALLFTLIGLEALYITRYRAAAPFLIGGLCIPIALAGRGVSVSAVMGAVSLRARLPRRIIPILTWAGVRGAVSVAMALSLPPRLPYRETFVLGTYLVAVFSILVQATTVRHIVPVEDERAEERRPADGKEEQQPGNRFTAG